MARSKKSSDKIIVETLSVTEKIVVSEVSTGEEAPPAGDAAPPESTRRPQALRLLDLANPLDSKLGKAFFSEIPKSPGIYFFESAHGAILYVGKAKNLRNRLQS